MYLTKHPFVSAQENEILRNVKAGENNLKLWQLKMLV